MKKTYLVECVRSSYLEVTADSIEEAYEKANDSINSMSDIQYGMLEADDPEIRIIDEIDSSEDDTYDRLIDT